jgi:hypothetical protein
MLFGISKTSINGALALLIVIGLELLHSGSPLISPFAIALITLGLGICRAIVGSLQGDAPQNPPPPPVAMQPGVKP